MATPNDELIAALKTAGVRGCIRKRGNIKYGLNSIPWNLRCQPKPIAIVHALDSLDVSRAVKVAASLSIPVQARSGGHSFGSYSLGGRDGALVVDLSLLNTVQVEKETWLATIGGGARLGSVSSELYRQGRRAIAHGTCPQVGIGGHATIGGQGPLSRMYGLTLDHILDVEVVLADGTITHANKSENSDLFWALRGAGASFGIITSFVFETHPAPPTVTHYAFQLTVGSPSDLASAFAKWQTFISTPAVLADRAFNSVVTVTKSALLVQGTRYGSRAELEASEVNLHLQKLGVNVTVRELDWIASVVHWAQDLLHTASGTLPIPVYCKSLVVRQSHPLTQDSLNAWFDYMHSHSSKASFWMVLADFEGGRISDFSNADTAYAHRDALYTMAAYAVAPLPFPDRVINFLGGMMDAIKNTQPSDDFGVYPGYVDPLLPAAEWPKRYWGDNYPRLLEIKAKYDPKNVFSNPQSVGQTLDFTQEVRKTQKWSLQGRWKWFLGYN